MARSKTLDSSRLSAQDDVHRVYAVRSDPPSGQACCHLDDGRAVLCAFETFSGAVEATSSDPSLHLVRHQSLSPAEQDRVEAALLA
jgi:hypothetical protein